MVNETKYDSEAVEKLDQLTSAPKVVGGIDGDVCTSVRGGENPRKIANQIEGIEYVRTTDVGLGRLAEFNVVD